MSAWNTSCTDARNSVGEGKRERSHQVCAQADGQGPGSLVSKEMRRSARWLDRAALREREVWGALRLSYSGRSDKSQGGIAGPQQVRRPK